MLAVAIAACASDSVAITDGVAGPRKGEFGMAYELQLKSSQDRVKIRSPWAAALLPIITLGIYHLVWWYRINRELRDYGRAKGYDLGQSPTNSLLALFPGGLIIVPALITYWRGTKRVQGAARVGGTEPPNGWLAVILFFVISLGLWGYLQVSLNDLWRTEAEALPGQEPPPVLADPMPPRLDDEQPLPVQEQPST